MELNRNNYEEYFLLYADNELSAEEKIGVELFVEENPDLKKEFLLIQQTILNADEVSIDKSFLLKTSEVAANNYEELLLLLQDGELNKTEEEKACQILSENPDLRSEFDLLKNVTFTPDMSVTFPDKSSLYRRENSRVISMRLYRIAAAAILLGFGLWSGYIYLKNDNGVKQVATKNQVKPVENNMPASDEKIITPQASEQTAELAENSTKNSSEKQKPQDIITADKTTNKSDVPGEINVQHVVKTNDLPKRDLAYEPKKYPVEEINIDNLRPKKISPDEVTNEAALNTANTDNAPAQDYYVQPTSYSPNQSSENYAFYNVSEEQFHKTKISAFLKKAKRVITRNLKGGDRD